MVKSKLSKMDSILSSEEPATKNKGIKKKPKLNPIPDEDSHMPIQEDSEEIKYQS